jgi:cbb3-type cytochrome oxidase subunit 3
MREYLDDSAIAGISMLMIFIFIIIVAVAYFAYSKYQSYKKLKEQESIAQRILAEGLPPVVSEGRALSPEESRKQAQQLGLGDID